MKFYINIINRKKQTGTLSIEMAVAVGIMGILFTALAMMGTPFKKASDQRWTRHIMLAAGQAQIDAIVETGKPIDNKTFERLWPRVKCTVEYTEGTGQWKGLQKIQLHLSAKSHQKTITTSLTRYIPTNKGAER